MPYDSAASIVFDAPMPVDHKTVVRSPAGVSAAGDAKNPTAESGKLLSHRG